MANTSIWLFLAVTFVVITVAIEGGYRLGRVVHRRSDEEKESPVSAIAGSILGLLAFILAFTFGIVTNRYDARKGLIREEAGAIRTAFARKEFLPEGDRERAGELLRRYVGDRVTVIKAGDYGRMGTMLADVERIQRELWEMAVVNARKDMNSDVAALYIESLNEMARIHADRVTVGMQARVPDGIWVSLGALVIMGMAAVGYQTAIAGSKRSATLVVLALCFTIVLGLIAALDNPQTGFAPISQQPLEDVLRSMERQ